METKKAYGQNIPIDYGIHQRIKIVAAQSRRTIKDIIEDALLDALPKLEKEAKAGKVGKVDK